MEMLRRRPSAPLLTGEDATGTQERWTPKLALSCIAIAMGQMTICCYFLQWSVIAQIAPELTPYNKREFPLAFSFYGVGIGFMMFLPMFLRNTQKDRISDRMAVAIMETLHACVMLFLSYLLTFARDGNLPGMFLWPASCPLVGLIHACEFLITPAMLVDLPPVIFRGTCASFQGIFFAIGFAIATFSYAFLVEYPMALWHFLNVFAIVTHAVQAGLLYFVCVDNPRWLVHKQQFVQAAQALHDLGRRDNELAELKKEAEEYEKSKRGNRFNFFVCLCNKCGEYGLPLFIGVCIALVHLTTTGFYVGEIFRGESYRNITGFTVMQPALSINTPGLVAGRIGFILAGLAVNLAFVDQIGRRPLMIGGLASMCISFFVLAIGLHYRNYPAVVAGHFAYAIANSVGPNALSAFMIAELFPPVYRIAANSFALIFGSLVDFGIQVMARFIFDEESVREAEIVIMSLLCLIQLFLLYMFLPETCCVPGSEIVDKLTLAARRRNEAAAAAAAAYLTETAGTSSLAVAASQPAPQQPVDNIPMAEMARY